VELPAWSLGLARSALAVSEEPFAMLNGNVQGYSHGRTYAINPAAKFPERTLMHELGHIVLGHTAEDSEHHVRMMLASRSDLTEGERAAIDYLIDERDRLDPLHWVYEVTDTDRLRELAGSGNVLIRRSLADNRHLPQDVVDLLSADDDFAVRILLCENQPTVSPDPGLPVEIMHALLDRAGVPRLPAS